MKSVRQPAAAISTIARAVGQSALRLTLLIVTAVLLVGCGKKTIEVPTIVREVVTVEVKVPVPVERVPPAALLAPVKPPLPAFVAPTDPKASSALTPDGERLLLALIEELLGKIAALQAWATSKD